MKILLKALSENATNIADRIAIESETLRMSYFALNKEVEKFAKELEQRNIKSLALLMDNNPLWLIIDLACQKANVTLVPLPGFFTAQQMAHAIKDAGVQAMLTDDSKFISENFPEYRTTPFKNLMGSGVWFVTTNHAMSGPQVKAAKITYTSGTTGTPKGVCLSQESMNRVASSLVGAVGVTKNDRHLCLLPLAVLLENIAGVYAPILAGSSCILPSLKDVGMLGATKFDVTKMLAAIEFYKATTVILLPQMLLACVEAVRNGAQLPQTLRFIAVGGAPVSPTLLEQASLLNIPVYEGYGLSECASVVAVNTVKENKLGSVGKLLPHVKIKFQVDGEILLKGNLYSGYVGQKPFDNDEWYQSGDTGYLDAEGYLYLTGRKKNCFITSFGRNVAPEWVEREMVLSPIIDQAVIFGEAKPFNVAVIVSNEKNSDENIEQAISEANKKLPDYAQITKWLRADEPFAVYNEQMTATGRPRRKVIFDKYEVGINKCYSNVNQTMEENRHGVL